MSGITIYHNPDCGTSRNTLALIRHAGIEPEVIEYLKTPPTKQTLRDLFKRAGVTVRESLREKGTPFAELGLGDLSLSDDDLLDAMMTHPILINRPIVVSDKGVKLCRPSDVVLDLLPTYTSGDFDKEEGAPFLKDVAIAGDDAGLIAALEGASLPTDDLGEAGRTFFEYQTLGGAHVGFGGFERIGRDSLLRSIAVLPASKGHGIGKNLVLLLMRRAWDQGARHAFVLTTDAAGFFQKAGFKPVARADAPAGILATRQASSLCPATAALLSRPMIL